MSRGMNQKVLSLLLLGWTGFAQAGPSELNYQGVVLDSLGNGVTGTRAMTLKLYDAAIGGNLLYTENLGNVAVNKGVYSFNFGTNGTGNPKITETVTVADGTTSTFQKVLANTNVVTGSVSVTDGTYSWDQVNGPSDGGVNFDASYSSSLRRIAVTYFNGSPAAGKTINVTYRSPSIGLAGILSNENTPWVEISISGQVQVPRQKMGSVPYAFRATRAEGVDLVGFQETFEVNLPIRRLNNEAQYSTSQYTYVSQPLPAGYERGPAYVNLSYEIPFYIKELLSITINYSVIRSGNGLGNISFSMVDSKDQGLISYIFPKIETNAASVVIPINKTIPMGDSYKFIFNITSDWDSGFVGGGSINSLSVKAKVLKSTGFQ